MSMAGEKRAMAISRKTPRSCLIALLAYPTFALGAAFYQFPVQGAEVTDNGSATDPAAVKADYLRKLAEYEDARQKFEAIAQPYWNSFSEKRRSRNAKRRNAEAIGLPYYVLDQPPAYQRPPKPVDPFPEAQQIPSAPPKPIPLVEDMLRSAAEEFRFAPDRPKNEIEFKKAYARFASDAGITKDQAVRIYGFEAGGNGKFDVQAGLEYDTPGAHPISTALGYNQLLSTNSVELMTEQGDRFLQLLGAKSKSLQGDVKTAFDAKLKIVRQMLDFSRSVPDDWSEHEKLANTPRGLAIHCLNLDIHVGPMLQTQQLLDSILFSGGRVI